MLTKRFNPADLAKSATGLSLEKFVGRLSEIADVDRNLAKAVLHVFGAKRISDSLRKVKKSQLQHIISSLHKIDPDFRE